MVKSHPEHNDQHENASKKIDFESIHAFRDELEKIDADLNSKIDNLKTREDISELMREVELKMERDTYKETYTKLYHQLESKLKSEIHALKKEIELDQLLGITPKSNKSYLSHNTFLAKYEDIPLGKNVALDISVATLTFIVEFVAIIGQLGSTLVTDLIRLPRDIRNHYRSGS